MNIAEAVKDVKSFLFFMENIKKNNCIPDIDLSVNNLGYGMSYRDRLHVPPNPSNESEVYSLLAKLLRIISSSKTS